jgi:hypothetical protein
MEYTLKIDNPIIVKEIERLTEECKEECMEKIDDYLDTIMNIGSILLNNATEISADCRVMSFLPELFRKTEETINGNIDDKLGSLIGKNSAMLGKLAENIYEKILKKNFPSFSVVNTATSGDKCGDIVIDTNTPMGKISIESKNYETSVPKDQIDKFQRDLKNSGIPYGIMISTDSQITGKKDFEVEFYEDKIILYIQNGGYDGKLLNLGIQYLLTYHELDVLNRNPMNELNTNKEYRDKLDNIASHLQEHIRIERSLITELKEGELKVSQVFTKVKNSLYKLIAEKEALLDRVKRDLQDIKIEYRTDSINYTLFEDILHFINDECTDKSKTKRTLLTRAVTTIHQNGLNMSMNEGIVSFYKEGTYYGKIECNKSKQEIMIKERGEMTQSYNKNYVKYRNDFYILEINEQDEVWLYLEDKLNM